MGRKLLQIKRRVDASMDFELASHVAECLEGSAQGGDLVTDSWIAFLIIAVAFFVEKEVADGCCGWCSANS